MFCETIKRKLGTNVHYYFCFLLLPTVAEKAVPFCGLFRKYFLVSRDC